MNRVDRSEMSSEVMNLLRNIEYQGYSERRVMRAIGIHRQDLWFGHRARLGHVGEEDLALLRILNTFPWMIQVAESGYKEDFAAAILQDEAVKTRIRTGELELAVQLLNDPKFRDVAEKALGDVPLA